MRLGACLLNILLATGVCGADEPLTLRLWPDGPPDNNGLTGPETFDDGRVGNISDPTMSVHFPPKEKATDTAVVVFPGGGYSFVSTYNEGRNQVKWLTAEGITAIVVKYRMPNHHYQTSFQDAQRAMRIVRSHAAEWDISPHRIGVLGFSAGGHLASTASTHYKEDFASGKDDLKDISCRPDFTILAYPVITGRPESGHPGSFGNLFGPGITEELHERFSNDRCVDEDTPPAFLVHATDDVAVPVKSSLLYYEALRAHGVPVAMHIYHAGGHGFGAGRPGQSTSTWPRLCIDWMRGLGLLEKR